MIARTAEELGRSFAPARVRTSSGDRVLSEVGDEAAIVVATPGAEPVAAGGYSAVVLLDIWLLLGRADLRSAEEALRRWSNAAGLVRPRRPGARGRRPSPPRAAGAGALGPLRLRRSARSPSGRRRTCRRRRGWRRSPATPARSTTPITLLAAPPGAEVLGPVPVGDDEERVVVRVPRAQGAALSKALRELQQVRAGRKLDAGPDPGGPLRAVRDRLPKLNPRGSPTHPPLRRPHPAQTRDRGGRLRPRAAHPGHRPHRDHARRARRRPRGAAARRRTAGVHLARRRARSATWSTPCSSCPRRSRTVPRAACRCPS